MPPSQSSRVQKRVTKACDYCRSRRTKCELLLHDGSQLGCTVCADLDLICTFETPAQKRGPQAGSKRRRISTEGSESDQSVHPRVTIENNLPREVDAVQDTERIVEGVSSAMVDKLLPLYFTHVHNVWPIIYKATFNPQTCSSTLLLSMLAISSCISPINDGISSQRLYQLAEQSLHARGNQCRVEIIQSLFLLSLRQTGCGDKQTASLYAGRACCMALSMGLNRHTRGKQGDDTVQDEIRSRVYWNTYVLDKTLAEETGRPFLLSYRQTTTPLPSTDELEELEAWPPPTLSAKRPVHRAGHIVPRRGYILSCFAWTCRLGMIVEDSLKLDEHSPIPVNTWDQQFISPRQTRDSYSLIDQLRLWRESIPPSLLVNPVADMSPLPHHAVSMAWYETVQIQLYSRRFKTPESLSTSTSAADARRRCSAAAQNVIDIMSCLDRHHLLKLVSADILHILSFTALFQAFDTTNSDSSHALTARLQFVQCCKWLRDFSRSWPAASRHRQFLEGLIQGGMRISSPSGVNTPRVTDLPAIDSQKLCDDAFPASPEGLGALRQNFWLQQQELGSVDTTTTGNPANILQLPHLFWNSLVDNEQPVGGAYQPVEGDFTGFLEHDELADFWLQLPPDTMHPTPSNGVADNDSAVQDALVSYMWDATRK